LDSLQSGYQTLHEVLVHGLRLRPSSRQFQHWNSVWFNSWIKPYFWYQVRLGRGSGLLTGLPRNFLANLKCTGVRTPALFRALPL
jgi:hypothetical protein